jgi:hypothetical protein
MFAGARSASAHQCADGRRDVLAEPSDEADRIIVGDAPL